MENIYLKLENGESFKINEILDVKINKKVSEFCKFGSFAHRYSSGIFNLLYPNSYSYAFEGIEEYQFDISIYRLLFKEENLLLKPFLDYNIETVQDYIEFVDKMLKLLEGNIELDSIVKSFLDARLVKRNSYLVLKSLYPSMGWEKEWMKQTEDRETRLKYGYNQELKNPYYKYFKENAIFRAIMLSEVMGMGKFYGMEDDYFLYLLENEIPKCLNMEYEDMENYLSNLSHTWLPEYLELKIKNCKDEEFVELSEDDLDYVIDYCKKNSKSLNCGKYMFFDLSIAIIKALKEKYPDKNEWFNHFNKEIAFKLVKHEDYDNIESEIAKLMDEEYQTMWQIENELTLSGETIQPIIWNDQILCKTTSVTREYS